MPPLVFRSTPLRPDTPQNADHCSIFGTQTKGRELSYVCMYREHGAYQSTGSKESLPSLLICNPYTALLHRNAGKGADLVHAEIQVSLVEFQVHSAPAQQRTLLIDPAPLVSVDAGLARRQDSRSCSVHHPVFVAVQGGPKVHCPLLWGGVLISFGDTGEMRYDKLNQVKNVDDGVVSALSPVYYFVCSRARTHARS